MIDNSDIKTIQIMWFKRDLRIYDNKALSQAALKGPILPLYIFEPNLWKQPDMSLRHFKFLTECLKDLDKELKLLGQNLIIRVGEATDILNKIVTDYAVDTIWSHQETWNDWTYQRDQRVRKWIKNKNITWNEMLQNGVIRGIKDRSKWVNHWYQEINKPLENPPKFLPKIEILSEPFPSANELNLVNDGLLYFQKGGRKEGLELINSFLYERGEKYSKEMSSPVTAYDSCSRLSPHFAFGTLSIREVFFRAKQRYQDLENQTVKNSSAWKSSIYSFMNRLRWHCHFIQKLEDDPRIEFENMHSAYNGLRENEFNTEYFDAWKIGKTGYPMVDACMRSLIATGWLNFRMRAMLVSFASYHLWLDWRKTAVYLAKLFTDYEPGIHYSQVQMQSGTTGVNSIRIYNPIKQGIDQDPEGSFIKKWIPELSEIPTKYIHVPWLFLSSAKNYPKPIIEEREARQYASKKIYSLRKNALHQEESKIILKKHATRSHKAVAKKSILTKETKTQLNLFGNNL